MFIRFRRIWRRKEPQTLEKLYLAYRSLMFSLANKILKNDEDAEDAVHEAFISMAANADSFLDPDNPSTKAYVSLVAECKAIDLYRRRQRHKGDVAIDSVGEETLGILPDCSESYVITRCISLLPEKNRHALLLHYCYGYTAVEIARILNTTPAAVAKLIQRGRSKLDTLCKEEGVL